MDRGTEKSELFIAITLYSVALCLCERYLTYRLIIERTMAKMATVSQIPTIIM